MGVLIGRRNEQDSLDEWCRSANAELVCVYGRHRVGKTYLIKDTFRNRFAFTVTGVEDRRTYSQFKAFRHALKHFGANIDSSLNNWFDVFDCLRTILERQGVVRAVNNRRVILLDEFPWLAGRRSDFLAAFESFWDTWASKQDDLMVILCGSTTSWFQKNAFELTGSLHARITRRLYIEPFDLHETEQMIRSMGLGWSRQTILEAYLVFGGLPHYLAMLDRRLSLGKNIDALCVDVLAPLKDEVPHLMAATLSKHPLNRQILQLLSEKPLGVHRTQIAESVGTNGNSIKRVLDDLEGCGYVRTYANPYERYRPSIYQLVDPFLLFFFAFMDNEDHDRWSDFEISPAYAVWRDCALEICIVRHVPQIKHALGIAGVETTCFPWSSTSPSSEAQIGLVIERKDGIIDLCEMVCSHASDTSDDDNFKSIHDKQTVFRAESGTTHVTRPVLVYTAGPKGDADAGDDVVAIALDDLFTM